MGAKLIGKLLSGITSDLAHSIGTREGVLEGITTVQMAVVVIVTVLLGITERIVAGIYLEFHKDVDERDVGDDGGVSTASRDIERNIRLNFGFILADFYVSMTVSVHEIKARRVTAQRSDLEDSLLYMMGGVREHTISSYMAVSTFCSATRWNGFFILFGIC